MAVVEGVTSAMPVMQLVSPTAILGLCLLMSSFGFLQVAGAKALRDYALEGQVATAGVNDIWKVYNARSRKDGTGTDLVVLTTPRTGWLIPCLVSAHPQGSSSKLRSNCGVPVQLLLPSAVI